MSLRISPSTINIGEIIDGHIKALIDGLWPVLGGTRRAPLDEQISELTVVKGVDVEGGSVAVSLSRLDRSALGDCDGSPCNQLIEVRRSETLLIGRVVGDEEAEPAHLGADRLLLRAVGAAHLPQQLTDDGDFGAREG